MPDYFAIEQSYKRFAFHEKGHRPKTVHQALGTLRNLVQFSGIKELSNLDTDSIRRYLHHLKETRNISPKTFHIYRQHLKTFFDWAILEGWISQNPVLGIQKPRLPHRLPRCITKNEALCILAHVSNYPWKRELAKSRNEAIFATFLNTGVRVSELLNLRVSDVNFIEGQMFIKAGKNEKDRFIPISPDLDKSLRAYRKVHQRLGTTSTWFFPSIYSEKQLTMKNLHDVFKKISKYSNIKVTATLNQCVAYRP